MVFALGFLEGLAESTDKGLQKGFERIREEIDSTAETQVKREEKAIDAVNKDTQEVMAKLRSAQAVLGGANDPKSAGRAAALLEQVGNVEDFDVLIANIKQYKLNNEETYDFTKYFDSQQDIAGVNLAEVAQNYALGLRPPLAEIGEVERRGGGIGELFGVNVADRSRAKADAQLASLGLSMPKITDVALPSIAFKSEALKLDKMNPDQELTYLKEKLLDPDTDEGQLAFYQTRMTEISDKMGLDGKINNLTFQINMATADEKPALLKQLQTLNQEKASFDVLSTGNKVDIAKFELAEALANGNTAAANAARDKLVDMGEMSLKDVLEARISQVQIDISRVDTDSTAGMSAQADLQRELEELATLSQNIDTALQSIKPVSPPTPAGIKAVMSNVSTIVNREILDNPEFKNLQLTVRADGSIDFPKGLDENTIQKVNEFRAKREKEYLASMTSAMPKDGDVAFVANMLGQGYNTSDMDALADSAETVDAGTSQDADELAAQADDATTITADISESDREVIASTITGQHGATLNENNLPNIVGDVASSLQEAATVPEMDAGADAPDALNVEDVIVETTEALTIAYGPDAVAAMRDDIRREAEKIVATSTQDITVTRMGKPVTYRQVGNNFYAVDEETGRLSNLPVGTNSELYDQLMSLTSEGQDAQLRIEEDEGTSTIETSSESFDEKMARLNPDVIYSEGGVESLLKGRATFPPTDKQVPYRRVGDKFFRIMDDGRLDRFPAGPVVTRKLLDMMEDTAQPSGSEPAEAATTSNEFGERPERDGDRSSPLNPPNSPKAMSDDALIAELVNNQMTSETAEELERRINADKSGKLALRVAKIVEKAEKARAQ
jgi:hypothetical protein